MDTNVRYSTPDDPAGSTYRDLLAEVGAMVDDDLERATIETKTDMDRTYACLLVLTHELDERRVTETSCGLPVGSWLQSLCRMTSREASGTLKTARAFAQMPTVAAQAVAGSIVASGVKLLAMTRDRHPEEFAAQERVFAQAATSLDPGDLRVAVSQWEQDISYEEALSDAESDKRGRELFFNQSYGGRWNLSGEFGVADGHVIVLPRPSRGRCRGTRQRGRLARPTQLEPVPSEPASRVDHRGLPLRPRRLGHLPRPKSRGRNQTGGKPKSNHSARTRALRAQAKGIITDADSQPIDVGRRTRPPRRRMRLARMPDTSLVVRRASHHRSPPAFAGEMSRNETEGETSSSDSARSGIGTSIRST